ncbi:MAG: hypothetical protein ORN29_08020, partial [Rhodoferax sp.]|nr:hypothetical protein [Rhodoferax sp.]
DTAEPALPGRWCRPLEGWGQTTRSASGRGWAHSAGVNTNGTERALFPDLSQGASTFKKAEREEQPSRQSSIF